MRGVDGVIGVDGAQGTQGVQGLTGPIAGSDTQVIFNDGGVSGATSDLVFDKTNKRLGIGTTALFSTLQVDDYGVAVGTGTFMSSELELSLNWMIIISCRVIIVYIKYLNTQFT